MLHRRLGPFVLALGLALTLSGCDVTESSDERVVAPPDPAPTPVEPKSEIPTTGADLFDGFEGSSSTVWAQTVASV